MRKARRRQRAFDSCVRDRGDEVYSTLVTYSVPAVEQQAGKQLGKPMAFQLFRVNQNSGPVTAFKFMHESFARVFNNNQPCNSGASGSCPCQNLGDWWSAESASGAALIDAATKWYNGNAGAMDSWTNAFVNNAADNSIYSQHNKTVAELFPGLGPNDGDTVAQADKATTLISQVTPAKFQQLGDALCQSPLAVRTYLWVIFDANKLNSGNGDNPQSNDFVMPTNPNMATLLQDPTKMVRLSMTDEL